MRAFSSLRFPSLSPHHNSLSIPRDSSPIFRTEYEREIAREKERIPWRVVAQTLSTVSCIMVLLRLMWDSVIFLNPFASRKRKKFWEVVRWHWLAVVPVENQLGKIISVSCKSCKEVLPNESFVVFVASWLEIWSKLRMYNFITWNFVYALTYLRTEGTLRNLVCNIYNT